MASQGVRFLQLSPGEFFFTTLKVLHLGSTDFSQLLECWCHAGCLTCGHISLSEHANTARALCAQAMMPASIMIVCLTFAVLRCRPFQNASIMHGQMPYRMVVAHMKAQCSNGAGAGCLMLVVICRLLDMLVCFCLPRPSCMKSPPTSSLA